LFFKLLFKGNVFFEWRSLQDYFGQVFLFVVN